MYYEKIKMLISDQFEIDEDDVDMETSFRDDLNADSLDLMELVMGLEDEFEMEFDDDNVEDIETVGDAVNYIEKTIGQK